MPEERERRPTAKAENLEREKLLQEVKKLEKLEKQALKEKHRQETELNEKIAALEQEIEERAAREAEANEAKARAEIARQEALKLAEQKENDRLEALRHLKEKDDEKQKPAWFDDYFKNQQVNMTKNMIEAFKEATKNEEKHPTPNPPRPSTSTEGETPTGLKLDTRAPGKETGAIPKTSKKRPRVHEISDEEGGDLGDDIFDEKENYDEYDNDGDWTDDYSSQGDDPPPENFFDEYLHHQEEDEEPELPFDELLEDDEAVGENLTKELAEKLCTAFHQKFDDKRVKEWIEKHPQPANCKDIRVPMVNQGLWMNCRNFTKQNDFRMSRLQKMIVAALTPMFKVMDAIRKAGSPVQRSLMVDAFRMLVAIFHIVNRYRREAVMLSYPKRYKLLMTKAKPSMDNLFGDELPTALKECNQIFQLGSRLRGSQGGRRPFGRGRGFRRGHGGRRGGHFLGGGRGRGSRGNHRGNFRKRGRGNNGYQNNDN